MRIEPHVAASASEDDIRALTAHTDSVAGIQNTLRRGIAVDFSTGASVALQPR